MKANGKRKGRNYKKKTYTDEAIREAVSLVQSGKSVYKAARMCGVPDQTLRDRVLGHVRKDAIRAGPSPLFTSDEENALADQITQMNSLGYHYTRTEIVKIATNTLVYLGKHKYFTRKEDEKRLSLAWFNHFLKRHPNLKVGRSRTMSINKEQASSPEVMANYHEMLKVVMEKYKFQDKPHLIYCIDDCEFKNDHPQPTETDDELLSTASTKSSVVTSITCASATGQILAPYIIFKGERCPVDLGMGATPGTTVTVTDSDWSNSVFYRDFLENHFMKFVPKNPDDHVLLIYNGHKTHFCTPLIEWAKSNNMVLFVLPPNMSHIFQGDCAGFFRSLNEVFDFECAVLRSQPGITITRLNMTELICKSHTKALSSENIIESFSKTGIFGKQTQ